MVKSMWTLKHERVGGNLEISELDYCTSLINSESFFLFENYNALL